MLELRPLLITGLITALLTGCSSRSVAPSTAVAHADNSCNQRLLQLQQRIETEAVADPFGYRIDGYPYLRIDRFLASFDHQLTDPVRFDHWYQQLYQLGQQGRAIEMANLQPPYPDQDRQQVEHCIEQQATADRQAAHFQQRLIDQAQVPELYSGWQQALGLFPLTRQIVLQQIDKQQKLWRQDFNSPELLSGSSRRFVPPPSASLTQQQIGDWLQQAQQADPLTIPQLDPPQLQALFGHFAPVWQLFQPSQSDWIGSLYWRHDLPQLNSSDPTSYLIPSYTRFDGQILLQLNYLVWFAERPAQSVLDLYSGRLDGLLWRVTLDSDGSVLLYDSIHPCGCYHQIFPVSPRLRLKPIESDIERPLIVTAVAAKRTEGRTVLQLTGQDHFLQGIGGQETEPQVISPPSAEFNSSEADHPQTSRYRFDHYQRLRSLPSLRGHRNLFSPNGLVAGTERLERWLLWPMGVDSPGAMRVWGQHAIGFANRRYFDQPDLLQSLLERQP